MFAVGSSLVTVRGGVSASEGLAGVLCQVVGTQGDLRDVRRVEPGSGVLTGISVRFLASELVAARR